ncbi:hypothetical protein BKA62DRAFT_770315 [Auriculariales sp. MPI-PUGE-AT-0066]|nr:hypothetical protein BKA62DRAFT_770315 [Auriculariales sp. MPI-PUGE-AT-0066]
MAQQRPLEHDFSAADDHARLPCRAGYGTIGRTFRASSNNFVINVGNCRMFYHFHITITDSSTHKPAPGFLAKRIVSNLMTRGCDFQSSRWL